jgi:hypothetical protein
LDFRRRAELFFELAYRAPHAVQSSPVDAGRTFAQGVKPRANVTVPWTTSGAQQVPVRQQGGQLRGQRGASLLACPQQHVRQARVRRELLHGAAMSGDLARKVQRTQPPQQLARAGQRGRWRRIQPFQRARLRSPHRKVQ